MISLAPYPNESNGHAFGRMIVPLCGTGIFIVSLLALASILPALTQGFVLHGAVPADARFMAQMAVIAAGLASIIGAPAVSLATRKLGKRRSLLVLLAVYALSGGVGVFEPGFAVLIASRIIIGFASGAVGTICLALIADYYKGPQRSTLLGISATLQMIISIMAILLCGWLADVFGWGAAFYVFFFLGLIALVIAWAFIIEPPPQRSPLVTRRIFSMQALAPVYPVYVVLLVFALGQFTYVIQGPFLLNLFGVTRASVQGLFAAIPIASAVIPGLFFGWLHSRVPERWIAIAVNLIIGLAVLGLSASRGRGEVIVLYVVIGMVTNIMIPLAIAMVVSRALPGTREASVGLILSVLGLGQFLNPIIGRPFSAYFGLRGALAGIGLIILVQSLVLILGRFGRNPPSPAYEEQAEMVLDDRPAT